jgi:toxin HigB-1
MIKSFADRRTRQLFEGQHVAAYDAFADQARRRLDALVEAATLRELQARPGNRFEALKGSRKGQYSVRINAQWRVCFRWEPAGDGGSKDPLDAPGNAIGVEIVDYR